MRCKQEYINWLIYKFLTILGKWNFVLVISPDWNFSGKTIQKVQNECHVKESKYVSIFSPDSFRQW